MWVFCVCLWERFALVTGTARVTMAREQRNAKAPAPPVGFWWPLLYLIVGLVSAFGAASGWIMEEEYTLSSEVDAPIDELFAMLTNVSRIAEVHPHLAGITRVIDERRLGPYGATIEWQLQTSAMWAPPWPLTFLKQWKTYEHVSTTAALEPGRSARIQNVGLKGRRGKIVPFCTLCATAVVPPKLLAPCPD